MGDIPYGRSIIGYVVKSEPVNGCKIKPFSIPDGFKNYMKILLV